MYVLIIGNIVDGVSVVGPFSSVEATNRYAEIYVRDVWVAVNLTTTAAYRE